MESLRRLRKRHMVRIAWRDLAGWAGLDETLHDLSALADAAIGVAYTYMQRRWSPATASRAAPRAKRSRR